LKLNRAAEPTYLFQSAPIGQVSLVKSSGGLDLPHQEGACLSRLLPTENEQEQDLLQG
jgi:hypothetical protein